MSLQLVFILLAVTGVISVGIGYFLRWLVTLGQRGSMELQIRSKMLEAQEEAKGVVAKAESRAERKITEAREEVKELDQKIKRTEERLIKKDELLDKRQTDIDEESESLKKRQTEIEKVKETANALQEKREKELESLSGITQKDAKEELMKGLESRYEEDLLVRMHKLEVSGEERLDRKAQDILAQSIQRMGNAVSSDIMSSTVPIPSDDVKGKIIGKEGRNIKAFERSSGVEVIIDDTPGTILISSFDPVRRAVARLALERLIKDGRIQPARIEEEVQKARGEVNKIIKEKGEQAAFEVGVINLDPRIISILGRLHFRTSYGQNVLQHSIEMAHIAGVIAEELGANVGAAKAGALLHDIGKAVDHEIQGTHVEIGRRILQKFGADEQIVKAMEAHHEEYPYETLESRIVQTADAISGARPGARRDSVENYLKRLAELEAIATGFDGVERSYALQAGREIRVFVEPEEITDLEAKKMAQEIAARIEKELKYPGEIKVHVIRESRVVEYAR